MNTREEDGKVWEQDGVKAYDELPEKTGNHEDRELCDERGREKSGE